MVVNYPSTRARVVFNHKYHGDHGRTILYPMIGQRRLLRIYYIVIATENSNSPRPYDGVSSF